MSGMFGSLVSPVAPQELMSPSTPAKLPKGEAAIDQASHEFESLFLAQMLEHMFSDVNFGGDSQEESQSQEVYRSMLVNEYGKLMSQAGGIGVADYVKREMLRAQEVGA